DSNPQGAKIYVNGKYTGRVTPDSLNWMEEMDYSITLKYPLYKDTTFTFNIEDGKRKQIFVDYYSNPLMYGKIFCETTPQNAEIYLDGVNTGKRTPSMLAGIIPGTHKVKYQATGCRADSLETVVESDKVKYTFVTLKDTTVWVTFNTTNSGIPTDRLSRLIIGPNDVKWIGTLGEGVVRYDGLTWKSYNSKNSPLPNDFITSLAFENNSNLWVGTKDGLAMFNGSSWTVYKTTNSTLPHNYVTSVCSDKNGTVWVGTLLGLIRIKNGSWSLFNRNNSPMGNNEVSALAVEPNGKLWLGVGTYGIMNFDGTNWNSFTKESLGLPGHDVTALAVGPLSEGLWAGFVCTQPRGADEGGLAVMENNTWHNSFPKLPSKNISSITIMNNLRWVCTDWGLLKFRSTTDWDVMNSGNTQLPSNNITSVSQDSHGRVWITTAASGLVKYKMTYF
ncbi:MAG: two-component regulator propeller domain-containing protein, partial [Acidobacteriota bacterium]